MHDDAVLYALNLLKFFVVANNDAIVPEMVRECV